MNTENSSHAAEMAYRRKTEEQRQRTKRIKILRVLLEHVVADIFKETEVEEGCWVPHDERIEWLNRLLADALQKADSNEEKEFRRRLKYETKCGANLSIDEIEVVEAENEVPAE
jgi:hypothetical protein